MILITVNDFTGTYNIPTKMHGNLQSYIDKYEKEAIVNLLGEELAAAFINDLVNGVPVSDRFARFMILGIKNIVTAYVYYEYTAKETGVYITTAGAISANVDGNIVLSEFNKMKIINNKYNEVRYQYDRIQTQVIYNGALYPEWNYTEVNGEYVNIGKEFEFKYIL